MPIVKLKAMSPKIESSAFIAENATVVGDVSIGAQSSVWYGAVVRGDVHWIRIGKRTNIQDNSVLHVTNDRFSLTLEDEVTVGHSVTLHGCHVKSRTLIGIGAILLDGVVMESESMVAAGSLVPPGTVIPSGVLMMGSPARVKRELTKEERKQIVESADHYVRYQEMYR